MKKMAEAQLKTVFGDFREILFSDDIKNTYVLLKGDVENQNNVLCRIHSHCVSAHYFYGTGCDCSKQMMFSQKLIEEEGQGIIIWLEEQEGKGNGHYAKLLAEEYKSQGLNQSDAYNKAGYPSDNRQYNHVKKILDFLNIESIVLISSSESKVSLLRDLGVQANSMIDINKCITT